MKKRIFSIVMAAMLTGSLAIGVSATSTELDGTAVGTVNGKNDIVPAIINVVVPTTFDFSVDAFERTDEGTKIYSAENYIINKSDVAVKTSVDLSVESSESIPGTPDVKIVASAAKVAEAVKADATAKAMWIAAIVPDAVTPVITSLAAPIYKYTKATADDKIIAFDDAAGTTVYSTFEKIAADKMAPETGTDITGVDIEARQVDSVKGTGLYDFTDGNISTLSTDSAVPTTLSFALQKAGYKDVDGVSTYAEIADANAGITTFRFMGEVNADAAWAADLVTITGKYTVNGITDTAYDDAEPGAVGGWQATASSSAVVDVTKYTATAALGATVRDIVITTADGLKLDTNATVTYTGNSTGTLITNATVAIIPSSSTVTAGGITLSIPATWTNGWTVLKVVTKDTAGNTVTIFLSKAGTNSATGAITATVTTVLAS